MVVQENEGYGARGQVGFSAVDATMHDTYTHSVKIEPNGLKVCTNSSYLDESHLRLIGPKRILDK